MAGVLKDLAKNEGDWFSIDDPTLPETENAFWQFCLQLNRTVHDLAGRRPDISPMIDHNGYGRSLGDLTKLIQHAKAQGYMSQPVSDHIELFVSVL